MTAATPHPTADSLFSDRWLTLREPADHFARDAQLTHALDCWLTQRATPTRPLETQRTLVDLGSGTGSNLRYLAPRLHGAQHWRLIDHDAELLAHARLRCEPLRSADGQPVHLDTQNLGLEAALASALDGADVVTASALFDLLSPAWIDALAGRCRAMNCAGLFTLSVDGDIRFHDTSGSALANDEDRFAFTTLDAHQRRDKGLGAALGTAAPRYLRETFHRHGYRLREAATPWRLGVESLALIEALMAGWRQALDEQAPQASARIDRWHNERLDALMRGHLTLTLGHRDLLAIPQERAA